MSGRRLLILKVVIIVFVIYLGSIMTMRLVDSPTIALEKVTLGAESSLLSTTVLVAQSQGYYLEEGLDLTLKMFPTGRDSFLAMLAGQGIDISTVAPTPVVFSSFQRQDFAVLATFVYSFDDVKIITRKNSGIKQSADLKGKKVGLTVGTTGQFFAAAYLELHGMQVTDIDMKDFKPAALPQALLNHQVDAIVTWEPHAWQAQQLLGSQSVAMETGRTYRETFNFMVMSDFVHTRSATLERFLRANLRATTFIENNKVKAQTIVSEKLNLDSVVVASLWDEFSFKIMLDQSLLLTMEDEARWAIRNGLTDQSKVPDYLNFLALGPLDAVKPTAVSVIYQGKKPL